MPNLHALIAIDHDDHVESLRQITSQWAEDHATKITLLGVTPQLSPHMLNPKMASVAKDAEKSMLADLRDRVDYVKAGLVGDIDVQFAAGRISDEIIKVALLHNADIIIKSADRNIGEKSPVFGAVEKKLIRRSPIPVWIIRSEKRHDHKRIAVAIDNVSTAPHKAEAELLAASLLNYASDLAVRFGVKDIQLIHAWSAVGVHFLEHPRASLSPADIQSYVDEWQDVTAQWLDGFIQETEKRLKGKNLRFIPKLVMGDARFIIPKTVAEEDLDLLIMGSANRSGLPGLFIGNTAEDMIDKLSCSTFVVKPEGFTSVFAKSA